MKKASAASRAKMVDIVAVLPLRDVVVYPNMVIPLFVGREKSINALEFAVNKERQILLVAQKDASLDDPDAAHLYEMGTLVNILQMLKLPDGTIKVLIEGQNRAKIVSFIEKDEFLAATVEPVPSQVNGDPREAEALGRSLASLFEQYVKLNKKIPAEVASSLLSIDDLSRLADTAAAHMTVRLEEKQKVLEMPAVEQRLEFLLQLLENELDLLQIERRIRGRVKQQMEKTQREYYLNEQIKAIQKELNEMDDVPNEIEELERKIKNSSMSKEARKKAQSELAKLRSMSPLSAEATVVRNYIEYLVNLPWRKKGKLQEDLSRAVAILEEDHYGLEEVKSRIVEYLAVQKRLKKPKGSILCLVGPPGVGKTSLGESIARATNRKFVRMALGGVHDEAEIRGHRRTYIGSMPGRIIQSLIKAKQNNPLFLLDEVDKMASDFRGDPAAALLEVLDPEQNKAFADHYLELDYDLSDVMFVATANSLAIPEALLDRMEIIRLPGYTEEEKLHIAKNYLVAKQIERNGLKPEEITMDDQVLRTIIRLYTREAGVRSLEREIAKVCRKVTRLLVEKKSELAIPLVITKENLQEYLGIEKFSFDKAQEESRVGQVTGLAWTQVGGELMTIETAIVPGRGQLQHTGKLGEVMRESVQAALTVIRSRADTLGIARDFYEKNDIHIHFPEGAIPKDGPSAGIATCTALTSALTGIPVRSEVAMTGEITLRGEVLPIGGLKEKLLAAHRAGIKEVLIPEENLKDLAEIPAEVQQAIRIIPVRWIDQVLDIALTRKTTPRLPEALPVADKPAKRTPARSKPPVSRH